MAYGAMGARAIKKIRKETSWEEFVEVNLAAGLQSRAIISMFEQLILFFTNSDIS